MSHMSSEPFSEPESAKGGRRYLLSRLLCLFIVWQLAIRLARKLLHFPAPAFIGFALDSDHRRRLQPSQPIIERSGIGPGMKVLEIGCGSGCYTTFVARSVGPEGQVFALDIQPGMLAQLARKLGRPENHDLANVTLVEHSAYDLPFEDGTFDVAYFVTVLQEIPDPQRALTEVRRVLRPGGKVAITEWIVDPDYVLPRTTVHLAESVGLHLDAVLGNLWTYTARFAK